MFFEYFYKIKKRFTHSVTVKHDEPLKIIDLIAGFFTSNAEQITSRQREFRTNPS